MAIEQTKTIEALQFAIQMETDGKEFYLKASRESSNKLGKKLLESLAAAEDLHRQKFEEIYDAIRNKKAWPVIALPPDRGKGLKTIFARVLEEKKARAKAPDTEFKAITRAMDMEIKSYNFYKSQEETATHDAEIEFYRSLSAEERGHHLALLDYYEYLKDPASWFVQKEHHSLDGG